MKLIAFISSFFFLSSQAFSYPHVRDFDYSIVFGGCFNQDIVSLKINNITVFDRYKVNNASEVQQGNLSLTQAGKGIRIYYNGKEKTKQSVPVSHTLDVELIINNEVNRFQVDLRKGKVVLLDHCPGAGALTAKPVSVEQIQEPLVFM